MRNCRQLILGLLAMLWCSLSFANDGPSAEDFITSIGIEVRVAAKYFKFTHYKFIGMCSWLSCKKGFCSVFMTPELDEYLPDLVVSVYNGEGNNPWLEARTTYDRVAHKIGSLGIKKATKFELSNGQTNTELNHEDADLRVKSVDVIGSPANLLRIPYLSLKPDTTAFLPYYLSDQDVLGRFGIAELIRQETYKPVGNYIGAGLKQHWGREFPRNMSVSQSNDYKASLILALRAVDLVTNKHRLHTMINSTTNSCGANCAVANVIEEQGRKHAIWQMVYPKGHGAIKIGEDDVRSKETLGLEAMNESHGNYVFVVWRHYRGCVQGSGKFLYAWTKVPPTVKR